MSETVLQYGQISVASRFGMSQGPLKLAASGFTWKSGVGGKNVEIKRDDLDGIAWTKGSKSCQLGIKSKSGHATNFLGFRDKDLDAIKEYVKIHFNMEVQDLPMATSGRNWGRLAIQDGTLMFLVDGKMSLSVPLRDVSHAQQSKDDVVMELHTDDTAAEERQDVLTEMAFHVPLTNSDFTGAGEDSTAKAFLDQVLLHTDIGAASTDDSVCVFGDVAILNPRGRFEVELHLSFLSLVGQAQDFKIRYTSIQRLFVLPKSNSPHTLVVISLDPPIRKGQTFYTHVLCQFPSEAEETIELDITPEQLVAKNEKCGGKLENSLSGPVCDVFARVLRGLSGAKISKPGTFRSASGDTAIRCSYKADDGHLYPLERAFFYVQKPPMLLPFEDVESVEFARQGGGVVSSRTFDLVIKMKTSPEHQFRSINRTEWQSLFDFFAAKKIRVENLNSAAQGPGGPGRAVAIDDDFDPGLRLAEADSEEDDEDFEGGDASSSEDINSGSEDGEDEESGDAELVEEEGISVADIIKTKRKRDDGDAGAGSSPSPKKPKPLAPTAKKSAKGEKAEADGEQKKARKKKDPNAPKGALSAFMYFSNEMRSKVKEENPGIAFGEVGKLLGERWKAATADEKAKFEQMAEKDKDRYKQQMAEYKAKGGAAAGDAQDQGEDDDVVEA
ncbi:hypothetical protein CEUSTIGMA_g3705.t1 [Chlamydomonas eustigma]|uniref:FACT complex subunit SSRP1 n=1 Tax=Chlamydomonas eustigma TaxID=1157962 RepID=A0A250WZK2_9CHLO|nr:hypothetical protein CEUSTIGMA_g3705.t1 [Chlamydomonas eustigma]|eukprot:GAX76261.1 hypothetical protein CEUSTIGMA_g3705.t1 [Chlamydomonas eustigma]